jgi:hypothetical protein
MKKLAEAFLKLILLAAILWFIIMNTDGCKKEEDARTHWAKSNID